MPLLLSRHFSLAQRETSRTHLQITSAFVIVVRTVFRSLSMHFGNIPTHSNCLRTIGIRKTSSICLPAGCTKKLLYPVWRRRGPLMLRAETRDRLMIVQEVLAYYLRQILAKTGQPLPT